jgi:16S rRNA (cytidine1402-2'-O)-methyltransferase
MSKREKSSDKKGAEPGPALYIIATPIGNLEDITLRALRILGTVDVIAAEDTRRAGILLSHYNVKTPVTSFFSAHQSRQAPAIIERIKQGASVALITEAGTPGLSDPGHYLVSRALEEGVKVIPIPGPAAALAALMASGMDSYAFTFYGFIPPKGGKRRRALDIIASLPHPVILYESPHRIKRTLNDLLDKLGPRRIFIAREITKIYEEFLNMSIPEAIEHYDRIEPRGEFTLIVMSDPKGTRRDATLPEEASESTDALGDERLEEEDDDEN